MDGQDEQDDKPEIPNPFHLFALTEVVSWLEAEPIQ